jgi:hypothetical protein
MNILELFTHLGADALHKQYAFGDYLGEHSWNFDLQTGLISFGDRGTFPFQLLGSQSDGDGSWLWAWANPHVRTHETILRGSLQLYEFGVSNGIAEFTEPEFECRNFDGHMLAMVASGLFNAGAYYRCPYEGGAAFVLVDLGGQLPDPPVLLLRMNTIFLNFISSYEIADQRAALASYAQRRGVTVEPADDGLRLSTPDGSRAVATFDGFNRLAKFESVLVPGTAPG